MLFILNFLEVYCNEYSLIVPTVSAFFTIYKTLMFEVPTEELIKFILSKSFNNKPELICPTLSDIL